MTDDNQQHSDGHKHTVEEQEAIGELLEELRIVFATAINDCATKSEELEVSRCLYGSALTELIIKTLLAVSYFPNMKEGKKDLSKRLCNKLKMLVDSTWDERPT